MSNQIDKIIGSFQHVLRATYDAHAAQSHLPLMPNSYREDDEDKSAGSKIERARNHLSCLDDPDDEIEADTRLSKAIDFLMQAREKRRRTPGGLGQHHQVKVSFR
jgi:hypothetical protein